MKILGKTLVGFAQYRRNEVIDSILDSAEAQAIFLELETKKNQPIAISRKKARDILLELTSAYNSRALKLCYWIVRFLQKFMFKGVATYGEEIQEIENFTREGKILFYLPNHKSHMDYLLLSYILFNNSVAPPHIAAGVNLSFFPVGGLFRRTGAYFIRRKIAGNFLYTKFLQLYFDWMLREKISQEFYMEGGRSRDGKIREAQSGIFTLFIEQIIARGLESKVYLVPTGITYDRLPEMKSLQQELLGAEKEKESIFALFKSLSILWTPHGRVHIQFSKPIPLTSMLHGEFNKQAFHDLSHQIFTQVQQQKTTTVASLVALVLLTSTESMDEKKLYDQVSWLMQFLKPCRQCISEDLANIQKDWPLVIERFEKLGWYEKRGSNLLINRSKRMEMNYYKNDLFPVLMPFFFHEDPLTLSILHHEYPYVSKTARSHALDESENQFLKDVCKPMLHLYEKVSEEITKGEFGSLLNKDVQKNILTLIRTKNPNHPYPEMLNLESIKSACLYYHHNPETRA